MLFGEENLPNRGCWTLRFATGNGKIYQRSRFGVWIRIGEQGVLLSADKGSQLRLRVPFLKTRRSIILRQSDLGVGQQVRPNGIEGAIDSLMRDRTVFIVAHWRLSAVQVSDRIGNWWCLAELWKWNSLRTFGKAPVFVSCFCESQLR